MENPYAPPSANVENVESVAGSPVKAVIVGLLIDIGGTMIAGIVLVAIYAVVLANAGLKGKELVAALDNIPHDSWVTVLGLIVGCLISVLGGYVCARIAKGAATRAGHIMAVLSVAFGLVIGRADGYSLPLLVAFSVATWGSVIGGVYVGRVRNRAAPTLTATS